MLLRIFLIALLVILALRFVGRLFHALLMRSFARKAEKKDPLRDIDESQIQDADFKDL